MPEGPSFMTDCHMDLYFSRPGFIFPSELRVQQQNNIRFSKEMKTESEHARQYSIRSPEILDTLFRLHLCRFRRGIWPWIQHDLCPGHWRFYWNPTPGGVLRIGKQEIPLEPEFFYLIPPFLRFSTFARAPFDQFFVHFNLSVKRPGIDRIFRLPTDPETVSRIRRFIADSGEWENLQMRTLLVHAILSEVLLRLPEEMFRLERCPDPRIAKICRLLEEPEGGKRSNAELAALLHMSRNSFIRLFHRETGETPQRYHRKKCIEKACELLRSGDRTIDDVAEESGFSDRSHFSRIFTQITGISPGVFRKRLHP